MVNWFSSQTCLGKHRITVTSCTVLAVRVWRQSLCAAAIRLQSRCGIPM